MIQKDYKIITNKEDFDLALEDIKGSSLLTYDVESTGLNVRKDKIIGIGIGVAPGRSYYFPTMQMHGDFIVHSHNSDRVSELLDVVKTKKLVMHNASYDIRITQSNYDIDLTSSLHADTMLLKHTVDEDYPFGLKQIAIKLQDELGLDVESEANKEQLVLKASIKANGGKVNKTSYELYKADMRIIGEYACADVDLTYRIFNYYSEALEKEGLVEFFYDREVMPLYKEVTIPMEMRGIPVNVPYLVQTQSEIIQDMAELEYEILNDLKDYSLELEDKLLKKDYPVTQKGAFAQGVAMYFKMDLPKTDSGAFSLAKANVENLPDSRGKRFLQGTLDLTDTEIREIRMLLHETKRPGEPIINISSKQHLGHIFFGTLKETPIAFTDKGFPKVDGFVLDQLAEKYDVCRKIRDYNKLSKIKGAYIDRFLDEQEDGIFYASYQQHRTISGRYGSDLQQLNRPIEVSELESGKVSPVVYKYNNRVREFFISGPGYVFIDSDYESLEPHIFAHMSKDEGLRDVFRKGNDLYSTVAISAYNLDGMSADKKADNYLGKMNKTLRQNAKAFTLGIPYGVKAWQLSKMLNCTQDEAQTIIDRYLNSYPGLKKYMQDCEESVKKMGKIASEMGRVRHVPEAKRLYERHGDRLFWYNYRMELADTMGKSESWKLFKTYKNYLNNAKNFPIQSTAASIVNMAAIAINRKLRAEALDAWVCMQVHDEICVRSKEEDSKRAAEIIQETMENIVKLSVPLKAEPSIGTTYAEAK